MISCCHGEVFKAIVIGTGFAGAVTAARLVQAGQRICVLERGRKFEPNDFPMYPDVQSLQRVDGGQAEEAQAPDVARWFWPVDQGLYDIRDLDDVIAIQAAGYGGGSLIYANVHLRAPPEVFEHGWPKVYRRKWLDPFYDLAACMLDVRPIPKRLAKTEQLERAAAELGREGDWFRPPLAVHFGAADVNRWGRTQGKCDMRGQCWLGCRAQAKNTLDRNYLAIVDDAPDLADVRTLAEAFRIERPDCACGARFAVRYRDRLVAPADHEQDGEANHRVCCAEHVFICAGSLGTTELLLRSADLLACDIKRRLGSRYHPNADSIAAVFDCDQPQEADFGPTITAALLYRGARQSTGKGGAKAAPVGAGGELWVLEFTTSDHRNPDLELRLKPGVPIQCGAAELHLVEAPQLDFGRFDEPDSHGMLVVDGPGAGCGAGELLLVGPGGEQRFGRLTAAARPLEDWFLIEDGGYPTDIEPLLGVLRSPLWLRRNRYLEENGLATQRSGPGVNPGPSVQARFPLPTAIAAFQGTPKRPVGIATDLAATTETPFRDALTAGQPLDLKIDRLLPKWLLDALATDRTELAEALALVVGPFIGALLDDLAEQLNKRFDLQTIAGRFGGSAVNEIGTLDDDTKITLVRGLLRQGIQVLWGSEVALAQQVNSLLLQKLPRSVQEWAELLAPFLGWLMQYRQGNGRTALLLTMGRDQHRGKLKLDTDQRLTVSLPSPLTTPFRTAQEGLLRDIAAKGWHGELRTNPGWTVLKRRFSVHNQGGCPMSSNPSARVTDHTGQVTRCPGLYVMDAAAFPSAVGVNPSATILAVAEYKIARFIKKVLRVVAFVRKPSDLEVEDWVEQLKVGHQPWVLDPIAARMGARPKSQVAASLGLSFVENMAGLFSDLGPDRGELLVDWATLNDFDQAEIAGFEAAERGGIARNCLLRTELTASIDDLDHFLKRQRQGLPDKVRLEGKVTICGREHRVLPDDSYLQFFTSPLAACRDGRACPRFFRYRIAFDSDGIKQVIEAAKVLRDDPRFDVWYDLSTLYFEVFEGEILHRRGIMRLAPVDFVEKQLPSINITPTDTDPSRKGWAYFAFIRYFAAEVARVYVRHPDLAKDFLRNVVSAAHGH